MRGVEAKGYNPIQMGWVDVDVFDYLMINVWDNCIEDIVADFEDPAGSPISPMWQLLLAAERVILSYRVGGIIGSKGRKVIGIYYYCDPKFPDTVLDAIIQVDDIT